MRIALVMAGGIALLLPGIAHAEPIGRWRSGFGQGTLEYGIKNDSAGSDEIYIACSETSTMMYFSIGGAEPPASSQVILTIGNDEFQILTNEKGIGVTDCHVCADNFDALWPALRSGSVVWVSYQDGKRTKFTLDGSSKALPPERCKADFWR